MMDDLLYVTMGYDVALSINQSQEKLYLYEEKGHVTLFILLIVCV